MSKLHCVVVTPEATALDTPASFIAVPLYDGEKGIAKNHAPFIGRLGAGELRIQTDGKSRRFYLEDGFVQVQGNKVSVMTSMLVEVGRLDAGSIREGLRAELERKVRTPEAYEHRDLSLRRLRSQLRLTGIRQA